MPDALRYGDLPARDRSVREVNTGNGTAIVYGAPVFLYCPHCGDESSATRGDYFLMPDQAFVTCGSCDEPMILAKRTERIEAV